MKHLFLSTLLIPLSLFSGFTTPKEFIIPEPDLSAHKVMDKTIEVLVEKYPLNPIGFGMNGKFEYLEISFQMCKNVTRDELRKMLFDCANEFLKNIKDCEKIQPYLKPCPYTLKNTGIVFFIRDENNNDVCHPNICCAEISRGKLIYHTKSKENRFRYKETYEETHEEALSLLGKDAPSEALSITNSQ